jgi:uncharacterized protein (TIGR04255 family)
MELLRDPRVSILRKLAIGSNTKLTEGLRAMARAATTTNIRLPNAPLVEAVFELRWALQGPPGTPSLTDPGFLPMRESFTKNVARLGFVELRDMVGPQDLLIGNAIARRFYLAKDQAFPLMQMGPGIFATNQSAEYEWSGFKKQVLDGIRAVVASYPTLPNFPLNPNYLELRYLDAFDASLVGTTDLIRFLDVATTMKLEGPPSLSSKKMFADERQGRVILQTAAKAWESSQFIFDLASGQREKESIVRLETKVVTTAEGTPKLRNSRAFLSEIGKWLEFAHGITSLFFRGFVKPPVMEKFNKAK